VTVDAQGNIFIPDGQRVRRVDRKTGIITTVAGGSSDRKNNGDGGPATRATLFPGRVAVDSHGNLFITDITKDWDGSIRRVDAASGIITTVSKKLDFPEDVVVDEQGNVFIALGWHPYALPGFRNRILRIDAVTGDTTTVAGDGSYGFGGDGAPAISATLGSPQSIAVDARGRLVIADSGNNRVRVVDLTPFVAVSPTTLSFPDQRKGTTSAPQSITVTNTGLVPLNISGMELEDTNAGDYAYKTTCVESLKPGDKCVINVTFRPAETGPSTASLAITDNASDSPQRVSLSGTGAQATASLSVGSPGR
jgi:hypothetical protein